LGKSAQKAERDLMNNVVLCRTKAGKGLKVVVDGIWYYTSLGEFFKMMNDKAKACTFRTIEDIQRTSAGDPAEVIGTSTATESL
jgi:hypothetical protein